jgi:hypothetical protein
MSIRLDIATLTRLIDCDQQSGLLLWKPRTPDLFCDSKGRTADHACANWNARYAGTAALDCLAANGYKMGRVFKVALYAHRVVWAMSFGRWPDAQIDHINGDRVDNRLENLREATASQNAKNVGSTRAGFLGVSIVPSTGKWAASISHHGKHIHCGCFEDAESAAKARDAKAIAFRGEFARLNFPSVREVLP